ncbi:permease [uncultured Clostridium sp.]|uniref:permease n=1 Tax=uncultured Clostridium sp. TaxID=59620 RepID=UPI00261A264B|nr:permease [uncultured Clostridium sp.]
MFDAISKFSIIFSSILLEALPFILIGAILSSVMQLFVTEEVIKKFIPKNRVLGSIVAAFLGVFMPVCECVTVPITKSLIQKKVPVNVAITYMLAAPIVSPLVIISTYIAFNGNLKIVILRVFIGVVIAIIAGLLMIPLAGKGDILKNGESKFRCDCGCEDIKNSGEPTIIRLLKSTSVEFYDIAKYFIVASGVAAIFQLNVTNEFLSSLGLNHISGIVIMMLVSFLISLCSEADAFVAQTFLGTFSLGGVMSFLIIGPMIDVKNISMLLASFTKSFVIKLTFVIFTLVFIFTALIF